MRSRDLPATRTDALTETPVAELVDRGSYQVVRTPSFPGYYEGQRLVLDAPPGPDELEAWIDRATEELAGIDLHRLVLRWETDLETPGFEAGETPAHYTRNLVLATRRAPPRGPAAALEVRPATSDADWEAVAAMSIACGPDATPGFAEFVRWRLVQHRAALAGRDGRWWCAFRGGALAGALGLYETPELVRFQEVQTHPAHRGLGVCTALCGAALASAFDRHPDARAIIVAASGSQAERIYRRLGFEPIGYEHMVRRPR